MLTLEGVETMTIRNLGTTLGILARHEAQEIASHADVDLWHAPSECHGLVSKNEHKRARIARHHAEAIARRPHRVIMHEAAKRGMRPQDWNRLIGCYLPRWAR